jgi:hypothetical protein
VKPSAMEKHKCKKGVNTKICVLRSGKRGGNKSIVIYEAGQMTAQRELIEEHQDVYCYEEGVDNWKTSRWDSVADGNHK